MSENISLKIGLKFAASLNMGIYVEFLLYIMSFNQHTFYQNNQRMLDSL